MVKAHFHAQRKDTSSKVRSKAVGFHKIDRLYSSSLSRMRVRQNKEEALEFKCIKEKSNNVKQKQHAQ